MIFQNFIKGGTERVNYGYFEYPPNADIIFDFGNPTCTSAFNTSRIVYNVGTQNITGSLKAFNNPSPVYPILNTGAGTAGGNMSVQYIPGTGYNEMTWSFASTENQTSIVVYAINGSGEGMNWMPSNGGSSAISLRTTDTAFNAYLNGVVDPTFYSPIDTTVDNGRNGYNLVAAAADDSTNHQYWENGTLELIDTGSIPRTTTSYQENNFGVQANLKFIAFLQYPRILSPKEMRQVYKVFSQRFFL